MTIKAIILIGGPNRGQRFRPLSFDSPKYMFPVGGESIIGHLIESCLKLNELSEIILLGFYQQNDMLSAAHLNRLVQKYTPKEDTKLSLPNKDNDKRPVGVRYLQEFTRMGTGGGLYHFRDQIKHGNPEAFFVINGDVCGDFDLESMLNQHRETIKLADQNKTAKPYITVMTTEASRQESQNYGCIVADTNSHMINHYVEKPSTFVSNLISCGVYVCSPPLLDLLEDSMRKKFQELETSISPSHQSVFANESDSQPDYLSLELDILQQRLYQPHCYSYRTKGTWWCQMKTAASAIYANRHYLALYDKNSSNSHKNDCSKQIFNDCKILGNVFIHPTAHVDSSAVIGPNVTIMENCIIGPGVRVKESIVLQNSTISAHSIILCAIVGWNCCIGTWVRIEGTPSEPDPNERSAKVQNPPLFNPDGKLNPLISVLGSNVKISCGTVILNTIVLPHKELSRSYRNEIVL